MSLLTSFTKRNKLNDTLKKTQRARKSEGANADGLFISAYQDYADILQDDPLRADTLYHWGFALLHHAKSKSGEEAAALYQDAITKFSFCQLINPHYLGAAINGGVAFMDLARLNNAKVNDPLYGQAKQQFENANRIQKSTASYNLACIYALENNMDACRTALQNARDYGVIPDTEEMMNDPDLANATKQSWFNDFLESLAAKPEEQTVQTTAESSVSAETSTTSVKETSE